jgi:hypothetical protein
MHVYSWRMLPSYWLDGPMCQRLPTAPTLVTTLDAESVVYQYEITRCLFSTALLTQRPTTTLPLQQLRHTAS